MLDGQEKKSRPHICQESTTRTHTHTHTRMGAEMAYTLGRGGTYFNTACKPVSTPNARA